MKTINDEQGNCIIIERVLRKEHLINMYIRLSTEKHRRKVGLINKKTYTMHVERSREIHLLNKMNAYGFNYHILNEAQTFDYVAIHEKETGKIYMPERKYMVKEGQFLFFKQQGFEKQIFLTLEWLKHYEVKIDSTLYKELKEENNMLY